MSFIFSSKIIQMQTQLIIISIDENIFKELGHGFASVQHIRISILKNEYQLFVDTYKNGQLDTKDSYTFSSEMLPTLQAHILLKLSHAIQSGLVLYKHNAKIFDITRSALLSSDMPFIFWFDEDTILNWRQAHFAAAARARITFSQASLDLWKAKQVLPSRLFSLPDDFSALQDTVDAASRRLCLQPLKQNNPTKASSPSRNILIVSYYAPPSETVAVHRVDYWHRTLPKIAAEEHESASVSVLSAIQSSENDERYIFVADKAEIGCNSSSAKALTDKLEKNRVNSFSSFWASHVRKYFEQYPDAHYDTVIMSGNPFYYFELGTYFKERFGAQIILDFRDPFANNPRFKYTPKHKSLLNALEDRYLETADIALSVNQYSLECLRLPEDSSKGVVVANGYDESVAKDVQPLPLRTDDHKINFVYTGSFYQDRKPDTFLEEMPFDKMRLIHIGRQAPTDAHLDKYNTIERYGFAPYRDVLAYCKNATAGLIFTSGAPFEQTTKIFDYIAADIDIIIITEGEPYTGELQNLTKALSGVHWVKNDKSSIRSFFKEYQMTQNNRQQRSQFSRYNQTKKLYKLIQSAG